MRRASHAFCDPAPYDVDDASCVERCDKLPVGFGHDASGPFFLYDAAEQLPHAVALGRFSGTDVGKLLERYGLV